MKDSEGQAAVDSVELHGMPRDLESVDALIHKKDDRASKEFEKWAILTYSDTRAVINDKRPKARTKALTALPTRANPKTKFCP